MSTSKGLDLFLEADFNSFFFVGFQIGTLSSHVLEYMMSNGGVWPRTLKKIFWLRGNWDQILVIIQRSMGDSAWYILCSVVVRIER